MVDGLKPLLSFPLLVFRIYWEGATFQYQEPEARGGPSEALRVEVWTSDELSAFVLTAQCSLRFAHNSSAEGQFDTLNIREDT